MVKMTMARFPSQTWYLMLASDVRPTIGKSDEPRATGTNKSATHKLPTVPSRRAAFSSCACHLRTLHFSLQGVVLSSEIAGCNSLQFLAW